MSERYSIISGHMAWKDFVEAAQIRLNEYRYWKEVFFEQTKIPIDILDEYEGQGLAPKFLWNKLKTLRPADTSEGSAYWIAFKMDQYYPDC